MADLPGGSYPQYDPLQALFGINGNATQANLPIFSNYRWFSGATADTASLAGTTTGVAVACPVPIDQGTPVTKISIIVGAGAAGTPTHSFAALYSGTTVASPPLIAQTTDGTTTAMAASTRFDFTFSSVQTITSAQAPYRWLWVAIAVTASTVPSCVTVPVGATACQFRWFTNSPLYFSQTAGSGLGATAAATLVNASTLTVAPLVALW